MEVAVRLGNIRVWIYPHVFEFLMPKSQRLSVDIDIAGG
jgi:hypothetical protein